MVLGRIPAQAPGSWRGTMEHPGASHDVCERNQAAMDEGHRVVDFARRKADPAWIRHEGRDRMQGDPSHPAHPGQRRPIVINSYLGVGHRPGCNAAARAQARSRDQLLG